MGSSVPITIVSGYLGAGKTTLLSRILSSQHGQRVAAIVSTVGELDIDPQLVTSPDDEVLALRDGSVAATVRADLSAAITRVLSGPRAVDHVVIETSGLTDLAPIVQAIVLDDAIRGAAHLDAIVTVVDACHVGAHWTREVRAQLALADVVLINKADLVSEAELALVSDAVRSLNARARIRATIGCKLPLDELLGLHTFDVARALSADPRLLERDAAPARDVTAVCLHHEGVVDEARLSGWLSALREQRSEDLHRLKGVLSVGDAQRRFVLQGVHTLLDGRPGLPWRDDERRASQLVLIGRSLDPVALSAAFEACFEPSYLREYAADAAQ